MGIDRYVHWRPRRRKPPSGDEIQRVLEDFVGDAAKVESIFGVGLVVTFHSKPSWPWRRVLEDKVGDERFLERGFVVWVDEDHLGVTTRHTDPFANEVANGFARRVAEFYEARLEMPK